MRNISEKRGGEKEYIHLMFNDFSQKNLALYEIKWKNIAETDRQTDRWQMAI